MNDQAAQIARQIQLDLEAARAHWRFDEEKEREQRHQALLEKYPVWGEDPDADYTGWARDREDHDTFLYDRLLDETRWMA